MPFRSPFDCLWCGRPQQTRSADDIEGWAQLCSGCLGRTQDNGFLKARLRTALKERSQAADGDAVATSAMMPATATATASPAATVAPPAASSHDDWYLRRGSFSEGPLVDLPWQMELDEATRWLDEIPLSGVIVELAGGAGWWSTLLAEKGELWVYDADEAALESARRRLVAHGLMAHLHQRDLMAAPERPVDVVFGAHLMGRATDTAGLNAQLGVVQRWLKPAGTFAFVESRVTAGGAEIVAGPGAAIRPRTLAILTAALRDAGFENVDIRETHSAFVVGRASAR